MNAGVLGGSMALESGPSNFLSGDAQLGARQADELYKICSVLGTPTQESWAEGLKQGSAIGFRSLSPTGLETIWSASPSRGLEGVLL